MGALTDHLPRFLYNTTLFLSWLSSVLSHDRLLFNARFACLHELSSLHNAPLQQVEASLLLGVDQFGQVLRVSSNKKRRELGNLLIVAPTRGGKGLLAVSQLLTWKHSVVVNDIKGELFKKTAGFRSTLGKVFVLDPKGVGHRYDPLLGKNTEDELLSSATHLLFNAHDGEGAIFTQRAIVMLTQLFLAARAEGAAPLPYVRHIIRQGLVAAAERLNTISAELATQFLDIKFEEANFSDRFLLSAWGTLSARIRPLLTETVVRTLAGADFTPEDIMCSKTPITVYLRWKEQDLLALSPLVRLLWGSLIDELITLYDSVEGRGCKPVLLLVDEAGRTAIPGLADNATTVVGREISLWVSIQSLSQLDVVYGKDHATVLMDNMESQLYYPPANMKTAYTLEHHLGPHSEFAQSQTVREGNHTSEGRSEQGIPLLTAQAIKQLDEDIIGFHRKLPPFKIRFMDWRRFPLLAKRRHIPPPKLSLLPLLENRVSHHILWRKTPASSYIDPDNLTSLKKD